MPLFFQPDISNKSNYLDAEESRHCIKVLRHKTGDKIAIIDGKGGLYEVVITDANHKKCQFKIVNVSITPPDPFNIHIAIAPTKNLDRIEWFIEKAVEIGIHEISFILCANSERKILKKDRLIRKAISAMKQSSRYYLPRINELIPYDKFINSNIADEKFIAFVDQENTQTLMSIAKSKKSYCLLVGPEGDFNNLELQHAEDLDFKKISLGKHTLRTETAGLIACHTLNLINT